MSRNSFNYIPPPRFKKVPRDYDLKPQQFWDYHSKYVDWLKKFQDPNLSKPDHLLAPGVIQ